MLLISGFLLVVCAYIAGTLLWSLAVHALPLWCGGLAGLSVCSAGGGLLAALMAALAAATATIIAGQLLNGFLRSPLLRACVGLAFAMPAAIAGYHSAFGFATAFGIGEGSKVMIAMSASLYTALAAWRGTLHPRVRPRAAAPEWR
ncbi:hypothetical protein EUU23_10475 [Sphingorhabdus sp. IMCC26285]|uniref:Uncharacterized protein n=1 Tax=Sphingorhabdus profundilacus TaxID=2509718 RepID=A0A6I4LX45_9SPHN|nr:hypothetical protein [Sphingorhabdus profundilacus]MVZ98117.1 hypothetical protein [Sphingorhabdus profundilacus]